MLFDGLKGLRGTMLKLEKFEYNSKFATYKSNSKTRTWLNFQVWNVQLKVRIMNFT
jgi:hypothetical protein